MLSQFITKGTISSAISVFCLLLSASGHPVLAKIIGDPATVQNVLLIISAASAIHAGVSEGVAPKVVPAPTAPPTAEDPYPGWDYDPLNGWVKTK